MPRGRKPKAAEHKEAAGNPGKRKNPKTPDTVPAIKSDAPDWLSPDAAKIWDRLVPKIDFYLKSQDVEALSRYCLHVAEFWKLTARLETEGYEYESESAHGKLKRLHPAFSARQRIERDMLALEDRFGLTVAARHQIMARLAEGAGDFGSRIPAQNGGADQPDMLEGEKKPTHESPVGILLQ